MFNELSSTQKKLLWSFFSFALASPIIFIYVNTYIWRASEDVFMLAIFNIGNYTGTFLGFLLNAKFLRYFQTGKLYALGCVLQGAVPLLLVTLGISGNASIILFGIALGIAQGFYWANRNAITSKITKGPLRSRFIGIETFLLIIAGVASPFVIGWFIVMGESVNLYTVEIAYQIVAIIGFLFLIASAVLGLSFRIDAFNSTHLFLKNASSRWKRQRVIEHVNGIAAGIESILPLLIILFFLGMEEAVGTVKSIASLLSALFILTISKRIQKHQHANFFKIWLFSTTIGSIAFAILYSPIGALIFVFCAGLVGSLRWSPLTSAMYEIVDDEHEENGNHRYLYLLDRELWLNAGRVLGLLVLMMLVSIDISFFVRYGTLLFISIQGFTLLFMCKQIQTLTSTKRCK